MEGKKGEGEAKKEIWGYKLKREIDEMMRSKEKLTAKKCKPSWNDQEESTRQAG